MHRLLLALILVIGATASAVALDPITMRPGPSEIPAIYEQSTAYFIDPPTGRVVVVTGGTQSHPGGGGINFHPNDGPAWRGFLEALKQKHGSYPLKGGGTGGGITLAPRYVTPSGSLMPSPPPCMYCHQQTRGPHAFLNDLYQSLADVTPNFRPLQLGVRPSFVPSLRPSSRTQTQRG